MDLIYYTGTETCPFCKSKFETTKIRNSRVKIERQDTDFCPYYKNSDNPIFYEVFICPNCSYAFNKNSKPLYEPYTSLIKEKYIEKVSSPLQLCGKRTISEAIMSFKVLYLVSVSIKEKKLTLGNIALKISWLYRYQNDSENEEKYLKFALNFFEESLATEETPSEVEKLMFLIAELNTKVGSADSARKMFSNIITGKNISAKYKKMATDRWQDYKYELSL